MQDVIHADHAVTAWYYTALSFTGPVTGVIIGGVVTQQQGGYSTKKGQYIQVYAGLASVIFSLPIPFIDDLH